jgi:hypothetical protein
VQLAALQWLAEHCPAVLENDSEALLRKGLNGKTYGAMDAPNFSELIAIELHKFFVVILIFPCQWGVSGLPSHSISVSLSEAQKLWR